MEQNKVFCQLVLDDIKNWNAQELSAFLSDHPWPNYEQMLDRTGLSDYTDHPEIFHVQALTDVSIFVDKFLHTFSNLPFILFSSLLVRCLSPLSIFYEMQFNEEWVVDLRTKTYQKINNKN